MITSTTSARPRAQQILAPITESGLGCDSDGQTGTATINYTVSAIAVAISPTKGVPGKAVTITGEHFWHNIVAKGKTSLLKAATTFKLT